MEKENIEKKIAEIESAVRPFLTAEALQRLNNLKIAHPDKYLKALMIILQLINSGQVSKITEDILKKILLKISEKERREPKIRFIHR